MKEQGLIKRTIRCSCNLSGIENTEKYKTIKLRKDYNNWVVEKRLN